MPDKAQTAIPPENTWLVESFRLTVFVTPDYKAANQPNWWQDLVASQPDSRVFQPKIGSLREEGQYDNKRLILSIDPTRIDWLLAPLADQVQAQNFFGSIGAVNDNVEKFSQLMIKWLKLETAPHIQRLAFGMVLLQPVPDRKVGYQTLSRYLPAVELDQDSTDFSYQINRMRDSTIIPHLKLNRLSKWAVMTFVGASISIVGVVPTEFVLSAPPQFACRLELDVNTAQDYGGKFDQSNSPTVFQELITLAQEIVREGDVK